MKAFNIGGGPAMDGEAITIGDGPAHARSRKGEGGEVRQDVDLHPSAMKVRILRATPKFIGSPVARTTVRLATQGLQLFDNGAKRVAASA